MSTIFTCENPQRIWNKFTREFSYVPCKKCNVCLTKRALFWTDKLNRESKCHPYTLFGTLTYAPDFLPYLYKDYEHGGFTSSDGTLFISKDELNEYLDYDSLRYIELLDNKLPYFRISDLQAFIKRLRSRVRANPSGEPQTDRYIRYFICYEFGETKLRPHAHFLIFTRSKWFAEHSSDVVASCWSTDGRYSDSKQLGRIKCELVKNSASSYVASYLTCLDSLPKVYQFRKLRPTCLFSKCPPLGSLLSNSEEVRQLFDSGSVYRSVRGKNGKVLQVLWPKDFCDRLYPRIFGFSRVPVDVLRGLYEHCGDFLTESFDEFFFHVKRLADDGFINPEYKVRSYDLKKDFVLNKVDKSVSSYLQYVLCQESNSFSCSVLHHLFSDIRRFAYQSLIFGISFSDYFSKIVDFWDRREKALLKFQLEWQSDVSSRSKQLRDFSLVKIDPEFAFKASHYPGFKLSDYFENGVLDSLSCIRLDNSLDHSYLDKVSLSDKIIHDGKNKHIKYEFLESDSIDSELKDYYKYLISKKIS